MYSKHNNYNIGLESMKLAVWEHHSISQIRTKAQPIAARYDSDSLTADKSNR